jgi:hypothetical protein
MGEPVTIEFGTGLMRSYRYVLEDTEVHYSIRDRSRLFEGVVGLDEIAPRPFRAKTRRTDYIAIAFVLSVLGGLFLAVVLTVPDAGGWERALAAILLIAGIGFVVAYFVTAVDVLVLYRWDRSVAVELAYKKPTPAKSDSFVDELKARIEQNRGQSLTPLTPEIAVLDRPVKQGRITVAQIRKVVAELLQSDSI